jgi:hypothetical protein
MNNTERLAYAVLLFHNSWSDEEKRELWLALTGQEAPPTTRVLCDWAGKVRDEEEGKGSSS